MAAPRNVIHPLFSIDCVLHEQHYEMPATHSHPHYELYILEQGQHQMLIHDTLIDVAINEVVFLKPNVFHKSIGNQGCKRTCIYFTERFLRMYFSEKAINALIQCFNHDVIMLNKDIYSRVKQLLLRLEQEQVEDENNTIFIYLADLCQLLNKHGIVKDISSGEASSEGIKPILAYINRNFNTIEHIEQIADVFYISKYHLCRLFKEATGLTIIQYMTNIKLQHACELLINSSLSILEIAQCCGFNSSMYFCKLFKQTFHVTPSDYRKNAW